MAKYTAHKREYNQSNGYRAQRAYIKAKCRVISLTLNTEHDSDILDQLDRQENRTAYIKRLIRADLLNKG